LRVESECRFELSLTVAAYSFETESVGIRRA